MAEYRVDELARAADTSVRNVRVYQDRGLLPPPRRVGRTGVYTEAHLARLRLIRLLLQRGYTFATIGELISAWSAGQGLEDLLNIDGLMAVPWSDESPGRVMADELARSFGALEPEDVERAVALGFLRLDEDGEFHVPSPRLLEAGAQLAAAGVPLSAVLDLAEGMTEDLSRVARRIFRMFDQHVAQEGRPQSEVVDALVRLRPFAQQAIDALLALAMTRESERLIERRAHAQQAAAVSTGTPTGDVEAVTT